ncbi:hypothetical protein KY284_015653 [Solanum tuberosum]|nr:hypothetical protein KY284_015653 [Solanum tuberosum]
MWKRGGSLGKGSYGFVSLAFTDTDSPMNVPSVIVVKSLAKIADFGLALTSEQNRTQKQGLRGTKRYMAPESLLKQEYGPGVDIWALGCTNPSSRWTAEMLLNHSFLKIADMVQPPEFTRKRPGYHSMYFSRLRQNKALRRQTHVRDMVTEIGADSESGNSELGTDSEGRNSELGADSEGENSELGADSEGGNSSQSC